MDMSKNMMYKVILFLGYGALSSGTDKDSQWSNKILEAYLERKDIIGASKYLRDSGQFPNQTEREKIDDKVKKESRIYRAI